MNNSNSSKNITPIPLIEVLRVMHQDILNFKKMLRDDKSDETIQHILEEISGYQIDERLPENVSIFIAEMMADSRNISYDNLCNELNILSEELEEAIKSQQHNDNVDFMRSILKVMYKHADEIARWMEEEFK